MIIGSMKEIFLTRSRDTFLFDCRVAGLEHQSITVYREVLSAFIQFVGDVKVRQLSPDHVSLYISHLSDGPNEGDEHDLLVMNHYAMIQTWIHWMYSQKFINERSSGFITPPRLNNLFPQSMNVLRIKTLAV